jgi:nucleoid-associated protein YgaU
VRFQAKTSLGSEVVDVLALGELAAMAQARDGSGRVRLSAAPSSDSSSPGQDLLGVRREEDGSVLVAGLAAEAREFTRVAADAQAPSTEWRDTGLKADVFAGMWIAVS